MNEKNNETKTTAEELTDEELGHASGGGMGGSKLCENCHARYMASELVDGMCPNCR